MRHPVFPDDPGGAGLSWLRFYRQDHPVDGEGASESQLWFPRQLSGLKTPEPSLAFATVKPRTWDPPAS